MHEFSYTGDDVVVKFIKNVLQCEQLLINKTKFNKYMIFTNKNRKEFEKASVWFICNNNKGIKGKPEFFLVNPTPKYETMIILQGYISKPHTKHAI